MFVDSLRFLGSEAPCLVLVCVEPDTSTLHKPDISFCRDTGVSPVDFASTVP